MTAKTLCRPSVKENITAPASKSEAVRELICAALADRPTRVVCSGTNGDISAAVSGLNALGAVISYENGAFVCEPIKGAVENAEIFCGEAASVLRFLLPVVCALGGNAVFIPAPGLYVRPLAPLIESLRRGGAAVSRKNGRIYASGTAGGGNYTVSGEISSQFVSGLMLMLSLRGGRVSFENVCSRPYIALTASVLARFGCETELSSESIAVKKRRPLASPGECTVSGDWSGAAYFLTAGCIGKKPVRVSGLDHGTAQGDRAIIDILRRFGARVETFSDGAAAYPSRLKGIELDASDIPDLVPVLSAAAAAARGYTKIYGISRLKYKECDRVGGIVGMINSLGGTAFEENGCIVIKGGAFPGGAVSCFNDHRIAMSAAAASFAATGEVSIDNPDCVSKSYPGFWKEFI